MPIEISIDVSDRLYETLSVLMRYLGSSVDNVIPKLNELIDEFKKQSNT